MKNIIVSTGYMGSGSSAITDLIAEFDGVQNDYGDYEYVFLHCPNGVFDLEDKLLLSNNALRSDEAIRSFELQMSKLYDKKFWWIGNYKKIWGESFKQLTKDYINNITEYNYPGFYYMHEEVNAKMFIKLLIRKPFKMLFKNKEFKKVLRYNDGMRISYISSNKFYEYSKKYIYSLLNKLSNGKDSVLLDQLLLPYNLFRVDNYFNDDLKVIVVERDPRDVFIQNKYIWPKQKMQVPFPTEVNEFCSFYDSMRKTEKSTNSKKVLRIRFEDLIYNYDKTLEKIMKFLNFSKENHIYPKTKFKPEKSINNTQVFRNKRFKKEIDVIEKKLSNYLYDFPYELDNDVNNSD
jgi:hypothetical protein